MSTEHPCSPPDPRKQSPGAEWQCDCGQWWRVYVLSEVRFWRKCSKTAEAEKYTEKLRSRI